MVKGIRLTHAADTQQNADAFFFNLRRFGINVKKIELTSWHEMEDIRKLIDSAPRLTWLDLGKKGGGHDRPGGSAAYGSSGGKLSTVNVNEWALLLSAAPELTTFYGVKFFYEVSLQAQASIANAASMPSFGNGAASSNSYSNSTGTGTGPGSGSTTSHVNLNLMNLSMTDRSRIRKNDETASVLAWKCAKLRRVDHWEDGGGKVVVILKDGGDGKDKDKMAPRWETRRVKV